MYKEISILKLFSGLNLFVLLACFNMAFADEELEPSSDITVELAREETRDNLKYLLGEVLDKTSTLQATYGDFSPYGAALFKNGSVKYVWYAKPGQVVKEPAKSIPLIRRALQSQVLSGKIVGSAVVYKFKKDDKGPVQLNVEMEYQTGLALGYAVEMKLDADNKVVWGESQQANFQPRVFVIAEEDDLLDKLDVKNSDQKVQNEKVKTNAS